MSKMKAIKLAIGGIDSELTPLAATACQKAGYEFEQLAVYQDEDAAHYLLVIDGVPQSPWLTRKDMFHLVTSRLYPAVEGGEQAAHFEAGQSWKNYPRGEWEL